MEQTNEIKINAPGEYRILTTPRLEEKRREQMDQVLERCGELGVLKILTAEAL